MSPLEVLSIGELNSLGSDDFLMPIHELAGPQSTSVGMQLDARQKRYHIDVESKFCQFNEPFM